MRHTYFDYQEGRCTALEWMKDQYAGETGRIKEYHPMDCKDKKYKVYLIVRPHLTDDTDYRQHYTEFKVYDTIRSNCLFKTRLYEKKGKTTFTWTELIERLEDNIWFGNLISDINEVWDYQHPKPTKSKSTKKGKK